mmetsp:Transcript_55154/g.164161  ORF Transcript_55154/g.164161 Transcript_55154/m.164161 type:complete len:226 (-) Transcript_55154:236-913(-)
MADASSAARSSCTAAGVGGGVFGICLRSPTHSAPLAPSARSRCAICGVCARVTSQSERRKCRLARSGGAALHRAALRSESRPLARAIGTPAPRASVSRHGHSSDSTRRRALGCQCRRKRRSVLGQSTGRCCSATRGPSCSSASRESAVSVLALMSTAERASRSSTVLTMGSADIVSPTEAPWTQSRYSQLGRGAGVRTSAWSRARAPPLAQATAPSCAATAEQES